MIDPWVMARGIVHVANVPQVRVLAADAVEIRADPARTPLEGAVVDELAGFRVFAVALGLGADRSHHLRVAVVAALGDVDVAPGELQSGVYGVTVAMVGTFDLMRKVGITSKRVAETTARVDPSR
jgi:hypothetical protein